MFENYYAVIMAGGGGTRLWPLSRRAFPKQMVSLFDEKTMFQISINRLGELFPPERIYVVTIAEQVDQLRVQVPEIPKLNYIVEPLPKGTASVVALASVILQKHNPNATMAILTADHFIQNIDRFIQLLKAAYEAADQGYLVTLGIAPTYAATGYGYIQVGDALGAFEGISGHHAMRFLEKPNQEKAEQFFESGAYAWNSGMFVWTVEQIIVEFARQMPELYAGVQKISRHLGTGNEKKSIENIWHELRPETIDYGIMEGAENVAVFPVNDLGWSDIGSWESLFEVLPADENGNITYHAKHLGLETKNVLVYGNQDDRLIVALGVEDLVIVDTGDVILVCTKEKSQMIRQVVNILNEKGGKYT